MAPMDAIWLLMWPLPTALWLPTLYYCYYYDDCTDNNFYKLANMLLNSLIVLVSIDQLI